MPIVPGKVDWELRLGKKRLKICCNKYIGDGLMCQGIGGKLRKNSSKLSPCFFRAFYVKCAYVLWLELSV